MIEELKFFFNCFMAFVWFFVFVTMAMSFFSYPSWTFVEQTLTFVTMGLVFIMFVVSLTNAVVILIKKGENW